MQHDPATATDPPPQGTAEDALRPPPDASDAAALARPELDAHDRARGAAMIGRPLRGRVAAAARCAWGLPAVLRVDPALEDGTPFPTTFWLACPLASKACAQLESDGVMAGLTERLAHDPALAEGLERAHARYVGLRDQLGPRVPGDPSAGGMPGRVKCLHALYGHYLATGDNPVGAWVAERVAPMPCSGPCVVVDEHDEAQAAEGDRAPAPGTARAPGRAGLADETGDA